MEKKFKIGSAPFFESYPDYNPHDTDYLIFVDEPKYDVFVHINELGQREDIFYYKLMNKEEFITFELEHAKKNPMIAGKFLLPEIVEYFKINLDDLRLFDSAFKSIDDKHTYETIIYNAYLTNNGFYLTNEQRDEAYNDYKLKRQ